MNVLGQRLHENAQRLTKTHAQGKHDGSANQDRQRRAEYLQKEHGYSSPLGMYQKTSPRVTAALRRFTHAPASDKPPAEQILRTFDRLEQVFGSKDFRGCPFVNAVAELGAENKSVKKIAIAFKESRRTWFRDLLLRLDVPDPEGLATQLTLLVDGSIAQDLVRDDPSMARAAKEAARVLIRNAGVELGHDQAVKTPRAAKRRGPDRGKGRS